MKEYLRKNREPDAGVPSLATRWTQTFFGLGPMLLTLFSIRGKMCEHLASNYFSRYFWGYKTGLLLAALPQVLSDLSLKVQASSLSLRLETLLSHPLISVVPVWTPQIQTPFSLTRIFVIGS